MDATLDAENRDAWRIYGQLCSRFAVDFGVAPDLLRALVDGWSPDDVVELMERLTVMYDVLSPAPQPKD
jgi:hypothetical protein